MTDASRAAIVETRCMYALTKLLDRQTRGVRESALLAFAALMAAGTPLFPVSEFLSFVSI